MVTFLEVLELSRKYSANMFLCTPNEYQTSVAWNQFCFRNYSGL